MKFEVFFLIVNGKCIKSSAQNSVLLDLDENTIQKQGRSPRVLKPGFISKVCKLHGVLFSPLHSNYPFKRMKVFCLIIYKDHVVL